MSLMMVRLCPWQAWSRGCSEEEPKGVCVDAEFWRRGGGWSGCEYWCRIDWGYLEICDQLAWGEEWEGAEGRTKRAIGAGRQRVCERATRDRESLEKEREREREESQ